MFGMDFSVFPLHLAFAAFSNVLSNEKELINRSQKNSIVFAYAHYFKRTELDLFESKLAPHLPVVVPRDNPTKLFPGLEILDFSAISERTETAFVSSFAI